MQSVRGLGADQSPAFGRVAGAEQVVEGDVCGVAVPRLAVGERELRALGDQVDELGCPGLQVEPVEERQLLQQHRPLPPRARLAHRPAAEVERCRLLVRRAPRREVVRGQDARVALPGRVPQRGPDERVDLGRDEPARPRVDRVLELRLAVAGRRLGFGDQALQGPRPHLVAQPLAVVEEHRGGARPLGAEQVGHAGDGPGDLGQHGQTGGGVVDRRVGDLSQRGRAVVAQQRQPAGYRPGNGSCEQARARNQIQAQLTEVLGGRAGRCRALRAQNGHRVARAGEQQWQVAARAIQMRLDDLQREARRAGRVKSVTARLEHGHAGCRGEPVGGGDHPDAALQFRPGGEHVGPRYRGNINIRRKGAPATTILERLGEVVTRSYCGDVQPGYGVSSDGRWRRCRVAIERDEYLASFAYICRVGRRGHAGTRGLRLRQQGWGAVAAAPPRRRARPSRQVVPTSEFLGTDDRYAAQGLHGARHRRRRRQVVQPVVLRRHDGRERGELEHQRSPTSRRTPATTTPRT